MEELVNEVTTYIKPEVRLTYFCKDVINISVSVTDFSTLNVKRNG